MAHETLKTLITTNIKTNGQNAITAQILQDVLIAMVDDYPDISGYATQSWVQQQEYITESALSDYATQSWVGQNFLSLTDGGIIGDNTSDYRLHIDERGLYWSYNGTTGGSIMLTSTIDGLEFDISSGATLGGEAIATQTWVDQQGYLTSSSLSGYATQTWVGQQGYITSAALNGYATQTWVGQQGYITSSALNGYATQTWVGQNFLSLADGGIIGDSTNDYRLHIGERGLYWSYNGTTGGSIMLTSTIDGLEFDISSGATLGGEAIATQTWVDQQGFLTTAILNGYATETWVGNNYLPLTGGTITGNLTVMGTLTASDGNMAIYSAGTGGGNSTIFEFTNSQDVLFDGSPFYDFGNAELWAGSYHQASDIRKKTIIGDVPMNLYSVANAPLFKFTWNDEKKYSGQHIGTSAQYWQTVLPELVSKGRDEDMPLAMQYDVTALACAITVAKAVVDHEERIKNLENKILSYPPKK